MATLYQTSDGKKFYTKNYAENHAREAKLEDKSVKEVTKEASSDEFTINTAKEAIELINASLDVEQVKMLAELGSQWTTVQQAAEKKIEELTQDN